MAEKAEQSDWVGGAITIAAVLLVGLLVQLIYQAWPVFLALAVGAPVVWWFTLSPWARHERYMREARELHARAQQAANSFNAPSSEDVSLRVLKRFEEKLGGRYPPVQKLSDLQILIRILYDVERFRKTDLDPPPETRDLAAVGRYRDQLEAKLAIWTDPTAVDRFVEVLSSALASLYSRLPDNCLLTEDQFDAVAEGAFQGSFSMALGDMLREPGRAVEDMLFAFFSKEAEGVFSDIRVILESNYDVAKRIRPSARGEDARTLASTYLRDTPLEELFDYPVPYTLPTEPRFRHQWIVGDTGAGKTTLMSAMLMADIERAMRDEATVFVMDSQNELIPELARRLPFAPGMPLHDKLVYLEPDPDNPLALNIFDTHPERLATLSNKDRMLLQRGAFWMVDFFLTSLLKTESSSHQDTFLKYVIPAVMAIPDATIFTLKELLEPSPGKGKPPPGYERYKEHFRDLRPDTQQWLAERLHSPDIAVTRNAIRSRLDGFTADPFFHDMFVHPRNKLDLFNLLQGSNVILVNTMKGLMKDMTEPFGRYFIARLLQATEERMLLSKGQRLPVYVYIDEASDYIAEEENIEELMSKARKQNVALIFANQRPSQIKSTTVLDALKRAAIQCHGHVTPERDRRWMLSVDRGKEMRIFPLPVKFDELPSMSEEDFEGIRARMHEQYSIRIEAPRSKNEAARRASKSPRKPPSGDSDDPTAWGNM